MPTRSSITVIGHLGKDIELKQTQAGKFVCQLAIATSNDFKKQDGSWEKKAPTWHNVTVFGETAEAVAAEFKKGDAIHVEGKFYTESYKAQDGTEKSANRIMSFYVAKPIYKRKDVRLQPERLTDDDLGIGPVIQDDVDLPF